MSRPGPLQRRLPLFASAPFAAAMLAAPALAQAPLAVPAPPAIPVIREGAGGDVRTSVAQPETTSQTSGGYTRSVEPFLGPLGDPFGLRPVLKERGIQYSLTYITDVLGNPTGGVRQGAVVEDRLNLRLYLDLDRLAGWQGASVHANAYFIHGTGLSRYYVGNQLDVSVIGALPATRLYVLWFDQQLFDGKLGLRIGQQAADSEFFVSQTATLFVNSSFGWPAITGANLPSGGPAYPLAAPAVRAKFEPGGGLSFQAGLYDGDPAGANRPGDDAEAERLNRTGTNFRVHDPALIVAEAAYSYNTAKGSTALPGTVTFGGWQHFGRFDDLRRDTLGLSLADPASSGVPRQRRGNAGIYAMIDQSLLIEPEKDDEGLSVFVRASLSPTASSAISAYVDAGIAYKGLIPGRDDDTIGAGIAYARFSDDARRADRDTILFTGTAIPRRRAETAIEATYQALVVPGFTVQPDVQYVIRPGGGIADAEGRRLKNATVLGVRATVQY